MVQTKRVRSTLQSPHRQSHLHIMPNLRTLLFESFGDQPAIRHVLVGKLQCCPVEAAAKELRRASDVPLSGKIYAWHTYETRAAA